MPTSDPCAYGSPDRCTSSRTGAADGDSTRTRPIKASASSTVDTVTGVSPCSYRQYTSRAPTSRSRLPCNADGWRPWDPVAVESPTSVALVGRLQRREHETHRLTEPRQRLKRVRVGRAGHGRPQRGGCVVDQAHRQVERLPRGVDLAQDRVERRGHILDRHPRHRTATVSHHGCDAQRVASATRAPRRSADRSRPGCPRSGSTTTRSAARSSAGTGPRSGSRR